MTRPKALPAVQPPQLPQAPRPAAAAAVQAKPRRPCRTAEPPKGPRALRRIGGPLYTLEPPPPQLTAQAAAVAAAQVGAASTLIHTFLHSHTCVNHSTLNIACSPYVIIDVCTRSFSPSHLLAAPSCLSGSQAHIAAGGSQTSAAQVAAQAASEAASAHQKQVWKCHTSVGKGAGTR